MSSSTTPHPTTLTYRSPFLMKPGCGCWLGPMSLVVYLSMLGLRMLPEQTMQANRMLALYIFCFVLLCSSLVFFVFCFAFCCSLATNAVSFPSSWRSSSNIQRHTSRRVFEKKNTAQSFWCCFIFHVYSLL
jgi:hypothetical protein